mmetsp:Transcript_101131/g.325773  ORF Transcript_101131/g.325773 Transcript_101131/m.325773 type:complete len:328 (-) Transcript_101131:32-1015(-)
MLIARYDDGMPSPNGLAPILYRGRALPGGFKRVPAAGVSPRCELAATSSGLAPRCGSDPKLAPAGAAGAAGPDAAIRRRFGVRGRLPLRRRLRRCLRLRAHGPRQRRRGARRSARVLAAIVVAGFGGGDRSHGRRHCRRQLCAGRLVVVGGRCCRRRRWGRARGRFGGDIRGARIGPLPFFDIGILRTGAAGAATADAANGRSRRALGGRAAALFAGRHCRGIAAADAGGGDGEGGGGCAAIGSSTRRSARGPRARPRGLGRGVPFDRPSGGAVGGGRSRLERQWLRCRLQVGLTSPGGLVWIHWPRRICMGQCTASRRLRVGQAVF